MYDLSMGISIACWDQYFVSIQITDIIKVFYSKSSIVGVIWPSQATRGAIFEGGGPQASCWLGWWKSLHYTTSKKLAQVQCTCRAVSKPSLCSCCNYNYNYTLSVTVLRLYLFNLFFWFFVLRWSATPNCKQIEEYFFAPLIYSLI